MQGAVSPAKKSSSHNIEASRVVPLRDLDVGKHSRERGCLEKKERLESCRHEKFIAQANSAEKHPAGTKSTTSTLPARIKLQNVIQGPTSPAEKVTFINT